MKGKILFCSTNYVLENNISDYDIKLQITRYINKGLISGFIHVPHLSPSEELLNKTNNKWKRLRFTNEELAIIKNGKTHSWWDLYEPEFVREVVLRNDFRAAYNKLKEHLNNEKNIVCICYCDNKYRCHRKIIGEMLEKEGYDVEIK